MEIGLKNEFFGSFSSVSFCQACLSTDRALSPVSKYVDILYKICEMQCTILRMDNAHLCWECMSLLNKVKLFVEKITDSQKILESFVKNSQDPFPLSLSRLTSSQANTDYITLIYAEIEIKPIKLETELNENFETFDNFDYSTDVKDEPAVKSESPKVDKFEDIAKTSANTGQKSYRKSKEFNNKRNAKRQAKYRFVNSKMKKHRKDMVKKIPVEEDVLLSGLEEERNNWWFVKAEYKCVGCVEILENEEDLVRHNAKYHDLSLGSFACQICRVRFPSDHALAAHGAAHVRRECRVCGLGCCAARSMLRHLGTHDRMVQCLSCGLFYKNVRLFYDHYKAMHSCYECDECGKRCKTRDIIIKHLRCHFGYVCPFCKKKLKNSSSYNNHIECQHTATLSDGAYCVQCDRRFKNDRLYRRHLQASSAHATERDNSRIKRKYPCPECSNVYSRRVYMNNHYRHVHTKQSKHYCEQCDRHFLNRTRFTDHRRFKHEGARPHKDKLCNICGRGFAANRTLINHIRTHSGERPFACEHCGAKFTQKHAMLSHVKYIHLKSRRKSSWHE